MQKILEVANNEERLALLGVLNHNAAVIDRCFGVSTSQDGEGLLIEGEDLPVQQAEAIWRNLQAAYRREGEVSEQQLNYLLAVASSDSDTEALLPDGISSELICVSAKGRPVRAKTRGQSRYIKAMREHELTFAIGPAGTGKTFLAVAMAVTAFKTHQISRIILTRPAVEAGEKLGFLPGDLQTKVDPYMRPLYDALYELMGQDQFARHLERGAIEISPLAYMRGRTLDDAFIILDEAQNTSAEQMKMFLTRIGFRSRAVVTGDITQIDLPPERRSGLKDIERILGSVEGVSFVRLKKEDVVRNALVQRIIAAYEKSEKYHRPLTAAEVRRRQS